MRLRTLLVGTDLAKASDPAILRGHHLALRHDARLVVCHVAPRHLGNHSLFPQRYEQDAIAGAALDEQLAEAVSRRVVELTERSTDAFEVVIDQGSPADVLIDQARRTSADLLVVTGDAPEATWDVATVTRDLARSTRCSILVERTAARTGVAAMALSTEPETIPRLVQAAIQVAAHPPSKIILILWVSEGETNASWSSGLSEITGIPIEPWFARIGDTSVIERASADPTLGLIALAAPLPDHGLTETTSPLEDALPVATTSLLLLRELAG